MKEIAVLLVNNFHDRENLIVALNNAGYCTWVEEKEEWPSLINSYYVHVLERGEVK